jgi:hypothetical protein
MMKWKIVNSPFFISPAYCEPRMATLPSLKSMAVQALEFSAG